MVHVALPKLSLNQFEPNQQSRQQALRPITVQISILLNQGISKVYRIFPCCNALIFMYSHLNGYLFHLQCGEIIFERLWMKNLHFHDNIYTTFISERVVEKDPKDWYLFSSALFIVNSGHWGFWVLVSIIEPWNFPDITTLIYRISSYSCRGNYSFLNS